MYTRHILLAVLTLVVAQTEALSAGCSKLSSLYSNLTFFPGSARYEYENQNFWSNTEILSPACVFIPQTSTEVGHAIAAIHSVNGSLATRSSGHMGIPGSNNIDGGVLMAMSNMTTFKLDSDLSHVKLGPGWHWGDVYTKLAAYNKTVAGGRLSGVGVAGLLLGGGISFYGNQVGFSCDTVSSYEVVLASGKVVNASAHSYPDLFWALKGGANNFGIVTTFEMETIPSTQVFAGSITIANEYIPDIYKAIAKYAANMTDVKSHIVPAVVPITPTNSTNSSESISSLGAVILFYDSPTDDYPEILRPFLDIPAEASTMGFKTVAEMAIETGELITADINDVFAAGTVVAKDYTKLLEGVQIINDTFYNALPSLYAQVPASAISIIELDWQPITAPWLAAERHSFIGGNALGLDASKGSYLCYAEVVEWTDSTYDDFVFSWVQNTTYAIDNATLAAGIYDHFNYMGDSAGFEQYNYYNGYGTINKELLYLISKKYDPTRFFQINMPGGFKIGV